MSLSLVTAIDIGSDSVRVVSLRRRSGGFILVGAGRTTIAGKEHSDPEYNREITAAINRVVKKNSIPIGYTVVGLAGRGSMIRYLSVPVVPPWKLSLVMGFEVEEQLGAGKAAGSVAYDYRILNLPGFEEANFPMLLGLAQIPVINERIEICQNAIRKIDDVDLQCLGAFNLFRRSPQCLEDEISMLLDIGAAETHFSLQQGSSLLFARTIGCGGRQFTNNIQQRLGLLATEAEEYKINQACIIPRDDEDLFAEESVNASHACRSAVGMLRSGVENSLQYFYGQFKIPRLQPTKLFLTGGGCRLGGIGDCLAREFGCEVENLDIAAAVPARGTSANAALVGENAHYFAGAIGIALGQFAEGFSVSLLPPAIKEKRKFWSQEIYAYYAAALAVMLLVILLLGARRDANYFQERFKLWEKQLKQAKAEHLALEQLRERNQHLFEKLRALKVREASGNDLLVCLRLLQENTPSNVFFSKIETAGKIEEDAHNQDQPKDKTKRGQQTRNESFQKSRYLMLYGYIIGSRDVKVARNQLGKLKDKLQALDFFSSVEPLEAPPLDKDSEEIKLAYTIGSSNFPAPRGIPLKFIMKCGISTKTAKGEK